MKVKNHEGMNLITRTLIFLSLIYLISCVMGIQDHGKGNNIKYRPQRSTGDDETKYEYYSDYYVSCGEDMFTCGDENLTCIYSFQYCDGYVDCPNAADELPYVDINPGVGIPCTRVFSGLNKTILRTCLLTSDWICDRARGQCLEDKDELCWYSSTFTCVVHQSQRCDGFRHCLGGEDELNCQTYTCPDRKESEKIYDYDDYHSVEIPMIEYYYENPDQSYVAPPNYGKSPAPTDPIGYLQIGEGDLCDGVKKCANDMDECIDTCNQACTCKKRYKVCENGELCESTATIFCDQCADGSAYILSSNICNGIKDCADGSDEASCFDFTCSNGKVIHGSMNCNGKDDCGDWSDECQCSNSFQCANGRCGVTNIETCDGKDDCGDGSDECLPQCSLRLKFTCNNGKCISRDSYCDGIDNCGDNSDELDSTQNISLPNFVWCKNPFNVANKTCVLNQTSWFCDLSDHCENREDECMDDCFQSSFRCDGNKCLAIDVFCDGNLDCEDGTDEISPPEDESSNSTLCSNIILDQDRKCVLQEGHPWLCDGFSHCKERTDECGVHCKHSFHCSSGQCIQRDQVCNGIPNCADHSDENAVDNTFVCTRTRGSIKRTCSLPIHIIDDLVSDCDRDDDLYKNETGNNFFQMNNSDNGSFFQCVGENVTIPGSYVCNAVIDCSDMSDECFCENPPEVCNQICDGGGNMVGKDGECVNCTVGQVYCPNNEVGDRCMDRNKVCSAEEACAGSDVMMACGNTLECLQDECIIDFNCGKPAVSCDGNFDCDDFSDECSVGCLLFSNRTRSVCDNVIDTFPYYIKSYNCEQDGKYLKGTQVCDGYVKNCPDGRDELNCHGRFYCGNESSPISEQRLGEQYGGAIHIAISQICDGKLDCRGGEDEVDCPQHFYCDGGDPFFVSINDVMDGKEDCLDGSDECPRSSFDSDTFASRESMIRNWLLRAMVWVMGILSTIGNITVLVENILDFPRFKSKRPFAKVHYVLVLNLAVADLLMGFYLLALGIKVSVTAGSYCHEDKKWRTSSSCEYLGTMAVVSSVTSVLILLIMTSYRLYAVIKPFKCQNLNYIKTLPFAVLAWATGILLGFLPRLVSLADYFWTDLWISSNRFFKQDVILKANLTRFVRMVSVYKSNQSFTRFNRLHKELIFAGSGSTWVSIKHDLLTAFGSDVIKGHFGYYSVHSVCMPKIYVTKNDQAWEYSLAIVSFHFIAFIYILLAYLAIYSKSSTKGKGQKNRQSKMNKRITSLVVSDIVCWMPICAMAYLKISGVPISDMVYAVSAIVLLPINSALNPLLYSDAIQTLFGKLFYCKRGEKTVTTDGGSNEAKLSLTTKGVSGPPNEWISRIDQEAVRTKIVNLELLPPPKLHTGEREKLTLNANQTNNNSIIKDDASSVSEYDNYF